MKKSRKNAGFTLIELLITILILVILIVAIDTGMSAAFRIYRESVFQSNSAMLDSMLSTTLEDVLRYSNNVYIKQTSGVTGTSTFVCGSKALQTSSVPGDVDFLFTNPEYGAQNAYIFEDDGIIYMTNALAGSRRQLINTGAYPDLKVSNLTIGQPNGGIIDISFQIESTEDAALVRSVETKVRLLNE